MPAEAKRCRNAIPSKGHALAVAVNSDADRPGYVVFRVVETTAEAIGGSLVHGCCLRGFAGGSRARGIELVTAASCATVVSVAMGSLFVS